MTVAFIARLTSCPNAFVGSNSHLSAIRSISLTACTHERRPILADPIVHLQLIEFAQQGAHRRAWIGDYVLMPDHVHVFVAVDTDRISISSWIKSLKNAISKTLRNEGISAPHWQKGFFDHVLRRRDSYSAKWDYVRQNPVRAGLVKDATEWKFMETMFPLEFHDDRG
jgi:putative transposase